MKFKRMALVGGIAAFAFLAGIVFQRQFPVGKLILVARQKAGLVPESNADGAFVQSAPGLDDSFARTLPVPRLSPREGAVSEAGQRLLDTFATSLREEQELRGSESFRRLLDQLLRAREDNSVAEIEFQSQRIFRQFDLDSFQAERGSAEVIDQMARAIIDFDRLLSERGTHLIYCPIPNPLDSRIPLLLDTGQHVSARPEQTLLLQSLASQGVDVIDLRPEFSESAIKGRDPFHRYDHHWNPVGIELAADILHREIQDRFTFQIEPDGMPEPSFRWKTVPASRWNLEIAPPGTDPGTLYCREVLWDDRHLTAPSNFPVWLMGDSMMLEYSLERTETSADIGSHLGARLRFPTFSLGRPGTVDIRQAYFLNTTLTGSEPELLIWIHADENVAFPEIDPDALKASTEAVAGEAEVVAVSELPDPKTSPYPDALFSFRARLALTRGQTLDVVVYTLAFQDRQLTSRAGIVPGESLKLELRPWLQAVGEEPSLGKAMVIDRLDDSASLPIFWWP